MCEPHCIATLQRGEATLVAQRHRQPRNIHVELEQHGVGGVKQLGELAGSRRGRHATVAERHAHRAHRAERERLEDFLALPHVSPPRQLLAVPRLIGVRHARCLQAVQRG